MAARNVFKWDPENAVLLVAVLAILVPAWATDWRLGSLTLGALAMFSLWLRRPRRREGP